MDEQLEVKIIDLIRTVDQNWLSAISQCVATQDYDRLEFMLSSSSKDYLALIDGANDSCDNDEFTELINEQASAVRAVASIARAILEPRSRTKLVHVALSKFAKNGLVSVGNTDSSEHEASGASSSIVAIERILRNANCESSGFVYLLARYLVGEFPSPERYRAEVSGLVKIKHAECDSEPGLGVSIKLECLKDGPTGLHPDPRLMTFLKCNETFVSALGEVWDNSELSKSDACVVWSLTDGSMTLSKIDGPSLGLAFAVALDDIQAQINKIVRFKKVSTKCAFTGEVVKNEVKKVDYYREKIQAAVDNRWYTVVVPFESKNEIDKIRTEFHSLLKVRYAKDVNDAIRNARKWNDKLIRRVATCMVAFLVFSGIGYYAWMKDDQAKLLKIRSVSAQLINRSESALETNPRLAALSALASYRLEPSVESADALRQVSDKYASVVGTTKASEGSIVKVTHAAKYIVGSDVNGRVSVCRDDTECVSSIDLSRELSYLEGSIDGQLVVAVANNSAIFLSLSESGKITERSRVDITRRVDGADIELASVIVDSDNDVRFMYRDGVVDRYDTSAKRRDSINLNTLADLNVSENIEYTSADLYLGGLLTRERCEDDCFMVGDSSGRIYLYDGHSESLSSVGKLPFENASIKALACDDQSVLIATDLGVEIMDQESRVMSSLNLGQSQTLHVHDVKISMRGQIAVLTGGVLNATTASYFSERHKESPAQIISAASIGVGGNMIGMVVGTSDGRLVGLNDYSNETVATKMVATTALTATRDKGFVQTVGYDPMKITGLRFVTLDDSPAGYKVTQSIQGSGDMGKVGAYVNDIDVNGRYVAASGLTADNKAGSIVVWDSVSGKVVSEFRFGGTVKNREPIISGVQLLGDTGLVAGIDVSTSSLVVFAIGGDGNPVAVRKLGNDVLGIAYSAEQSSIFILNSDESKPDGSQNEMLSIDAASGLTKWKMNVGKTERMAVNSSSDEIVGVDGDVISVYSATDHSLRRQGKLPESIIRNGGDVAWSPDGSKIAYTGSSGAITVVDSVKFTQAAPSIKVENGKEIASFVWRSDSSAIAVGTIKQDSSGFRSGDDTYVFRVDATGWSKRMCEIAGQGFSSGEWDKYVGDVMPYDPLCAI